VGEEMTWAAKLRLGAKEGRPLPVNRTGESGRPQANDKTVISCVSCDVSSP
jgi:hypothetical protein